MAKDSPRIFISSTSSDLAEYREVLRNAVVRAGATPMVLEEEPASGRTVEERVQERLNESDAVVLLIGYRYGARVEEQYEAAKRLNKPMLAFLAAEDAPWPPMFVDTDRRKVEEFRRNVASDRVVSVFSSPHELALALTSSLARWVRALEKGGADTEARHVGGKHEIRIIRLLLSSPGDVAEEREGVARAVFRFNQDAVEEDGLFVKLVRWEDMAPQIGPKAQEVINKQIGRYHMFCGIMWNRFGTPTEIAASGTKEEFDGAVKCWEDSRRPWITFYFCDRAVNFTTPEQLDQKRKVLEFRTQLYDKGVVRAFVATQELEEKVYEDLKRIVKIPEFLQTLEGA
jgi:hypothetical protein